MNSFNKESEAFGFMDLLSIISFYYGYKNYIENIDQSQMQRTVNQAVSDIHEHLKEQDKKIDIILDKIGGADSFE